MQRRVEGGVSGRAGVHAHVVGARPPRPPANACCRLLVSRAVARAQTLTAAARRPPDPSPLLLQEPSLAATVDTIADAVAGSTGNGGSRPSAPRPNAHSGTLVRDGVDTCSESALLTLLYATAGALAGGQQTALDRLMAGTLPGGRGNELDVTMGDDRAADIESAAAALAGFGDAAAAVRTRGATLAAAYAATGAAGGVATRAATTNTGKRPHAAAAAVPTPRATGTLRSPSATDDVSPTSPLPVLEPTVGDSATPAELSSLLAPWMAELTSRAAFLREVSEGSSASGRAAAAADTRASPGLPGGAAVQQLIADAASDAAAECRRASALLQKLVLEPDTGGANGNLLAPSERRNGAVQLLRSLSTAVVYYAASRRLRELPAAPRPPKLPRGAGAADTAAHAVADTAARVAAAAVALDATAAAAVSALAASPPSPAPAPPTASHSGASDLMTDTLERLEAVNSTVSESLCVGAPDALWWGVSALV